ncbi:MAG TPA: isochorismatase family protein [Thermoanaerobaculia bacterium]|nr:isochorismatase family protein [Thermoanaerobaculia bacterium]
MSRLQRHEALLLVIDVQEKLMPVIDRAAEVEANIERLVRGCHVLDVPPLLTEQYVKGLGTTVPRVRRALEETFGYAPIEKNCFSANGAGEFQAELRRLRKKQILVAGVETHVCVYQTVTDLLAAGHEVTLVADAVSSRHAENKAIAIERMVHDGAKLSSTEMALFELLGVAGTDEFAQILKLLK